MVSCTDCEHPCNQWCADEVEEPNVKHRKDGRSRQSRRSLLESARTPACCTHDQVWYPKSGEVLTEDDDSPLAYVGDSSGERVVLDFERIEQW